MKNTRRAGSAAFSCILAAMMFSVAGRAQNLATPTAIPPATTAVTDTNLPPKYVTVEQVTKMPPCSAKLTKRLSEFGAAFTTTEGKEFIIGDIRGDQWV